MLTWKTIRLLLTFDLTPIGFVDQELTFARGGSFAGHQSFAHRLAASEIFEHFQVFLG
jgi:hypothetical protein